MATRAVRFSDKEDQAIKSFLETNPYLDFSTVARISILNFLEKPELQLKPVKTESNEIEKKRVQ